MQLSVIVPCFNEQEVLRETYSRLCAALGVVSYEIEFLFVDDGSTDSSLEILESFVQLDKRVRVLSFSRNFGHEAATTAGLRACTGTVAAIIDADLQDPPECIPEMVEMLQESGCDIVYGKRVARKGETLFKKMTASLFYRFLNLVSDVKFPTDTGDFRVISRKVIDVFNGLPERNKFVRGLIAWTGFKQLPFSYVREPRFAGKTKYTAGRLFRLAMTAVFSFSRKPLRLAINLGFLTVVIAFLLVVWAVLERTLAASTTVAGWASTVIIILFLGGVQLLSVGILGEYVGSIFEEIKGRPEYIVSRRINASERPKLPESE